MNRLIVIAATLLTLTAVSAVTATASSASVCQSDGRGCTAAGTYPGPKAVINRDYGGGFKVIWTKSVVKPYSSGVPLYWTAYVTYTNTSASSLNLACPNASTPTISEHMSGGSGNDGTVFAESSRCTENPGLTLTMPPGGTETDYATFHNVPWPGSAVSIMWGNVGTSPSVHPFGSTNTCRIDVRATGFAFGHLGRFGDHLWVVYTDMTGAQYHYEALPNPYPWNPFHQGHIKTYQGAGAKSKVGPMSAGPTIALTGSHACGKDSNWNAAPGFNPRAIIHGPHACFLYQMARIDKAKIPYNWSTTNSNAFAHTILYNCGIKPVKPNVNTPGWNWFL